jgi:phenylacetate-CoA ligase
MFVRWLPRFRHAARAMDVLQQRESWSRAQIEAWQIEKLNELWSHAVAHVPYYSRLACEHSLPAKFASIAEFSNSVPLLPRLDVRDDPKDFLSAQARPGGWKCTSGSSGKPLSAYWSHDAHQQSLYAKYRSYAAWGIEPFDRTVFLWPSGASRAAGFAGALSRARQPVIDRLRNRLRLPATTLSSQRLREYLAKMKAFAPAMLYGYSRALYLLALEAEAAGYSSDSLRLVVATSEPAWPHMIHKMERALNAPAVREYGAVECGVMATDAPQDRMLRVREDQILMETLPRNDGYYDIVVTVLTNPSFPLIRYAIGDLTDQPLQRPEGGGFAILSGIAGRDNDLLRTRSGGYLNWVEIEFAIEDIGGKFVRRYGIYQDRDGSVNAQIEPSPAADIRAGETAIAGLKSFFQDRLEGYPVEIRLVESIRQTQAGKHRMIQSEMYDLNTSPLRSEFQPSEMVR